MSDDPVEQALAELQDLVRCRCHPAYTGRGLHDPDCECDSTEAVTIVAERITQLAKACAEWAEVSQSNYQRAKAAGATLEKMIGGAETVLEAWDSGNEASFRDAIEELRADVEEAKGDNP